MSDVRSSQLFLDVAHLLGRQFIVEDGHADGLVVVFAHLDVVADFLQFSAAHIGHRTGTAQVLGETAHHPGTRRVGKKLEFVKIFLGTGLVLIARHKTDQHGGLYLCF